MVAGILYARLDVGDLSVCLSGVYLRYLAWRGRFGLVRYGSCENWESWGGGGFFLLGLEARSRLEFVPPGK